MTMSFAQIFPELAPHEAPYHLGRFNSVSISFDRQVGHPAQFMGFCKLGLAHNELDLSIAEWEGWQEVPMVCHRYQETDRNTFAFKHAASGDFIFLFVHFDFEYTPTPEGGQAKRLVEKADVYYVDSGSKGAIRKFLEHTTSVQRLG